MSEKPVILQVDGLVKRYGDHVAVNKVSFRVREGEFITLLGPSGCGKTTTLRMIGGYIEPTEGRVLLDGKDITRLPPQPRNMGMVFQSYALFPHMTVAENIAFPLRLRKVPQAEIERKVKEMLEIVRLPGLEGRRPAQLSGGQQQRVALARALAYSPRLLLMDEPLGALDVKLREHMQFEIKRIQKEMGITTLYVTHDQEEALSMSDVIIVMKDGKIVQSGTPREVYENPRTRYVADFVGKINLVEAVVERKDGARCIATISEPLDVEGPRRVMADTDADVRPGQKVWIGVRPEYLRVVDKPGEWNSLGGRLQNVKFVGAHQYLGLAINGQRSIFLLDSSKNRPSDGILYVTWPEDRTLVLTE